MPAETCRRCLVRWARAWGCVRMAGENDDALHARASEVMRAEHKRVIAFAAALP